MVDDALELIRLRNNFYRNSYRRLILVLLIMLVVNVTLVGMVYYEITHRAEPRYFISTADGRIMPIFSLSDPMLAPSEITDWAKTAAISAYSYNYVNYREAFQQLQNQFTANGWKNYEAALRASLTLETVTSKKLIVSAEPTGEPVILERKVERGRYTWVVQLPMLVTYENPNEKTPYPIIVKIRVTRVPTVDMPKGIAIDSFVAPPGKI
jgi:intracellular multiplication protein IcmL